MKDSFAEVRENSGTGQKAVFSKSGFEPGQILCTFTARKVMPQPSRSTVQIKPDVHILLTPRFLEYLNHSCSPNVFLDTTNMVVISIRKIAAGDELTFFYPSTEWEMARPFACYCASDDCLGVVKGAAELDERQLRRYRLTDSIEQMLVRREVSS